MPDLDRITQDPAVMGGNPPKPQHSCSSRARFALERLDYHIFVGIPGRKSNALVAGVIQDRTVRRVFLTCVGIYNKQGEEQNRCTKYREVRKRVACELQRRFKWGADHIQPNL
ncbi:MAG: hypothetical protein WBE13_22545 [Candidatus Acidiferrum sp.]